MRWKSYLLLLPLLIFGAVAGHSQNLVYAEYFYNTDPGYGNGTSVGFSPAPDPGLINFTASTASLPYGFNRFFFRVKDENNLWSLTNIKSFYKEAAYAGAQDIVAAEFFLNTDPGYGNGTSIPFTPGPEITNLDFMVDVSGLPLGFSRLYIRIKDENGKWSLANMKTFYKEAAYAGAQNIVAAEYFLNTDPGFGNGTSIPFTPGPEITNLDFMVDVSGLPVGFNRLYLRVKDENGKWSLANVKTFYKEAAYAGAQNIVAAEYFLNTDPGFSNGTSIPFTPGPEITNLDFMVDVSSLPLGFNRLFVRVKDENGKWSLANVKTFFKEVDYADPQDVVKAEFFFNTDPGFGNGTDIPLTPAPDITNLMFVIDFTSLPMGSNLMHIRTLDENGKWSLTNTFEYCRAPIPGFETNEVYAGEPTQFTNTSTYTDENTLFYWDVNNNGTTDYTGGDDFTHTYPGPGVYEAKLILLGLSGCSDTLVQEVHVAECLPPTDLAAVDITVNSAKLQWTPANIETAWNLEYGPKNFTPGTGTSILNVLANSYLLTGLASGVDYDFYVQSVCSELEESSWAGPATFETLEGGPCTNPTDGGTIAASQIICTGSVPASFSSVSPASGHSGDLQYQWQISDDNITFDDISGAESAAYSHPGALTITTWFRRLAKVSCEPGWTGAASSNVIEIEVVSTAEYRTKASGNWNDIATWEYYNGIQWVDAENYPGEFTTTCTSPLATILDGHTVTVTAEFTFGSIVVNAGGTLTVQDGITITIPVSTSITVHGTLIMHGSAIINGPGNFLLVAGCTMHIGSAQGIHMSAMMGHIQVSGTRTYSSGAHYVYIGGVNQFTGDGIAQNTPGSITINNYGFVVTLSVSITISGDVNIIAGSFDADGFDITLSGNWFNTGTFIPGTGTVNLNCTVDVVVNATTFHHIVFGGSGTVTATGSLIIYGNVTINYIFNGGSYDHTVYGSWYNNGTYIYGTSTIYFACTTDVYMSGGSFYNVVFTGTGTVTATGSISFYGYVNIVNHFYAGTWHHIVYGNWTVGGTFVPGTSTIEFQGSNDVDITDCYFYDVVFSGSGTKTATGAIVFYGNVTINSEFNAGSFTHMVYGNWTVNGTFVYGTSTIDFQGSGNALIGSSNFYNVIFCGTGTNTATGPLTIYGDVLINWHFNAGSFTHMIYGNWTVTGTFVHVTSTIDFHGSGNALIGSSNFYNVIFCGTGTNTATGSLTIYGYMNITWHFDAGSFTHLVYGNWTVTGTFVYGTSTIDFHGSGNALIGSSSFYNVIFCGTGTNTATGPLTIYGDVLINWHFNAGSFTHMIYGNWTVTGTFVHGTSTIDFHGSGNALIGSSNFYNVIFCGTGTNTATGSLTIYGYVNITWHFNAGSYVHYVHGNWINDAVFIEGTSTIHFVGSVVQIIGGSFNTNFYGFVVNCPGGITLQQNITVNFTLTLTLGIINAGNYTVTVVPAATLTGGSADCYISGRLIRGVTTTGSKFFPVGKGGFYRPLTYNCLTLTGTSMVEVELILDIIPGTIPTNISTINRHWAVSQTGGSGITFQLTCNDEEIIPCCYVRMLRSDGMNVSVHNTSAPDYTNEVAFSAFGSFGLGVEPCIEPDIPTLSADVSICPEGDVNLEVLSGNLKDAEEWVWYADECGQNQVGTGLQINVSPESTTTYYVRGGSSCIVTGDCASITVTVDPLPVVQCPDGFCITPDEDPFVLSGEQPVGGTYSGPGVSLNQSSEYEFSPATAGEGSHVLSYAYTDPVTGCVNECMFVITVGHISYNLDVENHTIPAMTDTCFNACNTIMVENVVAEPASIARFIAGQRVLLKPGVHFMAGSDVNVFISTNGIFCEDVPLVAAQEDSKLSEVFETNFGSESIESGVDDLFRVYPNPTTGTITLELFELSSEIPQIQIFGAMGELMLGSEFKGVMKHEIDLSAFPSGLYFVRVLTSSEYEIKRIIKQ